MRIGHVCRGGEGIGWGHVSRGQALLEANGYRGALLVGRGFPEVDAWRSAQGVPVEVRSWGAPAAPLSPALDGLDVLVVDDYSISDEWLTRWDETRPVVLIDDWMRSRVSVRCLLNPNVGAGADDYSAPARTLFLCGPRYALLRAAVRARAGPPSGPRGHLTRVLVSLGGADPDGVTAEVAHALTASSWYLAGGGVTLVLGQSYSGPEPWTSWPTDRVAGLEVLRAPDDFLSRAASADLVVCGASVTSYEMAHLGLPIIPVAFVENQRRIADAWSTVGVPAFGPQLDEDWLPQLVDHVESLSSAGARREIAGAAQRQVDGRGHERVLAAMERILDFAPSQENI